MANETKKELTLWNAGDRAKRHFLTRGARYEHFKGLRQAWERRHNLYAAHAW